MKERCERDLFTDERFICVLHPNAPNPVDVQVGVPYKWHCYSLILAHNSISTTVAFVHQTQQNIYKIRLYDCSCSGQQWDVTRTPVHQGLHVVPRGIEVFYSPW